MLMLLQVSVYLTRARAKQTWNWPQCFELLFADEGMNQMDLRVSADYYSGSQASVPAVLGH